MIDEKKLIDRLRNMEYSRCPSLECWEHSSKDCGYCEEREIKACDAIKIVKELSQEYNNEWIPCSVELPVGDGKFQGNCYEVTIDDGNRVYTSNAAFDFASKKWMVRNAEVIAWQPLPEPFNPDMEEKKKTNADRIRSMSIEDLAEFLVKVNISYAEPCMIGQKDCKWEDYPDHSKGCKDCFKAWLQSEVE